MSDDQAPGVDVAMDDGGTTRIYFPEPADTHNRIGVMQLAHGLSYNFEAPDETALEAFAIKVSALACSDDEGAYIRFVEPMYGQTMFLFRNGARAARGLGVGFMDKVSPEVKMREMQAQQRAAAARMGAPIVSRNHRN